MKRLFRIERTTLPAAPYHLIMGWENTNGHQYDEIGYYLTEEDMSSLKNAVDEVFPPNQR